MQSPIAFRDAPVNEERLGRAVAANADRVFAVKP